jgi:ATP synthase protein I
MMIPDPARKNRPFAAMTQRERKRLLSPHARRSPLSWVAVVGGIGWLVVVPMVLCTAAGIWLDRRVPMPFSWTLSLVIAGTIIGCAMAWRWIRQVPKR